MKKGSSGETTAPCFSNAEVFHSLYRLRLIYAQNKGKLEKKKRSEGIRRDKMGRNKKL